MNVKKSYADIILPLPVRGFFTYEIPLEFEGQCKPGQRVVVPFGTKKLYTGLIFSVHHNAPSEFEAKPIVSLLETEPSVNKFQIRLWEWVADYYMCAIGEVYKASLPSGLRLESETQIIPLEKEVEPGFLSSDENLAYNILLKQETLSLANLGKMTNTKNPIGLLRKLMRKDLVLIQEEVKGKYKSKKIRYLKLNPKLKNEADLNTALETLGRAKKQQEALLSLYEQLGANAFSGKKISRSHFTKTSSFSSTHIKALIDKQLVFEEVGDVSRLNEETLEPGTKKELNTNQEQAFQSIQKQFEKHDTVLLHGVTSSGKTEIYIHLIDEALKQGKQVLYLLPEIALTTQIITRLKAVFGNKIGVYHSKFSDAQRVEIWNKLNSEAENPYPVILGVRSSIFLPFTNLGLIIVDEEHENTYKQYDPAPRYNARDLAVVLAKLHNGKVLMGTATPALETYYNAKSGRYGLVELMQRHQNIKLPEIAVADVKRARKKKQMQAHFTPDLVKQIEDTLDNKEQVILFQNRRGYSPYLECTSCGYVPSCKMCDVSLTYHKGINRLSCHYCGYTIPGSGSCTQCKHSELETRGFGTEKIENEVELMFPEASVGRLDLDTTRGKHGHEEIIMGFQNQEIDVLIGTQMVSKGLDFDKVSVVGILNADNMLRFPDFRANERSYQLMAQVSGRAGRKNKQGKVIIQTGDAENRVIKQVINNRYDLMFKQELADRHKYFYPPYSRLIKLVLKHRDKHVLQNGSQQLSSWLKKLEKVKVLGPTDPPINRIQNLYIKHILLKLPKNQHLSTIKHNISKCMKSLNEMSDFKGIQITPDVDPM